MFVTLVDIKYKYDSRYIRYLYYYYYYYYSHSAWRMLFFGGVVLSRDNWERERMERGGVRGVGGGVGRGGRGCETKP